MAKMTITLDTAKLKGLTKERTFKTRDGEPVTVKEIKLDVVEVKEPKVTYTADKYELVKTHFVSVPQTKEERDAKAPTIYVGEGITTVWKNEIPVVQEAQVVDEDDDIF